ncbi:histidinol-phosphate transaminase [Spongiivirga citrea]|uniref:Histidinol-phosphate aminotransferase n=1 Tax=Spongiivirga citrea TaxID=1481457 RepID=A0A6M0CG29_9FLAO|nr:histidinol-phosphate transaminase [Spongiivirga citrea]NER16412.1 histidinol-phosphate transaminase [Spongiivirga citrea]
MKSDYNINELVRPNILKLKPYSSARDEFKDFDQDMVFLDANENPFENGVNRYPDPQQRNLKSVLAEQKGVETNQILLGNGSDEVLDLIFRAFCEPKSDNIITLPPTYGMYKVLAETNDVENREVLLTTDFEPDVEAILNAADSNSKLLFLCSPNNPTANSFSALKTKELLNNFKGIVVIDEAYIDFSNQESWISALKEHPNLIVTQTLSKAYGLAGIRLGLCYASKEIISILNKIKPPYNVNELTQQRALKRVLDVEHVSAEVNMILEEKAKLEDNLNRLSFVEKVYNSDANFLLAKVDNADLRYKELLDQGIVVRNRSGQPMCENTLRFTVGTTTENNKLLTVLNELK